VDPEQLRRCRLRGRGRVAAACHHIDDDPAPVAACRHELRIAEALHQRDPGAPDADRVPPGRARLAREAVARHVGDHHVEGVRRARAMRGRVGEQIDDLQLLDERAGPSVADDEWQRVLVLGANVDEVDVQPVDLGDELRVGVQPRLALAPVVLVVPVARDLLDRRERHALRQIVDGLLLGPAGRRDARPQVLELRLGDADVEGADGGALGRCAWLCGTWAGRGALRHCRFLSSVQETTRRATRRPSRTSVAICCVDTAHAARLVSLAPGCVRVRPLDSPSGQSEWPVVARKRADWPAARAAGRWSGRWVGPGAAGRGS
jgi:hypothetical protein